MPISSLTRRALLLASTSLAASPAFGQMFSSITLSPQVFSAGATGAAPGTVVGTVTVTLAVGTFTGYLSLSSANFAVSGSNIVTVSTLAAGDYPLTITATQGCVVYSQAFNIIGTGLESQDGTTVPADQAFIQASSTPGMAGAQNFIFLTSNNTIQVNNGTPFGAAVTQLYKIGNTVFQLGSGAWYEPVTASGGGTGPVAAPQPTVSLTGSTSIASGLPAGTTIGTLSTAVGAGSYAFTYSLSDNTNFQLTGGNTLKTKIALPNGSYPLTVSSANSSIRHSPFTLPVTVQVGSSINFPLIGMIASFQDQINNNPIPRFTTENAIAKLANQPNNIPISDTVYNYYNNDSWSIWAGFGTPQDGRPYGTLSVAPWPLVNGTSQPPSWGTGSGFNPSEFITGTDALAAYKQLAQSCATASWIRGVNIGWEWNKGGANSLGGAGWDQPGQQSNYIQWFRTVAGYFRTYAPNVLIGWIGNGTSMTGGAGWTQEDFYPGDDMVDVIGDDIYGYFCQGGSGPGTVSTTDRSNYFGWCTQFSAATNLGTNHPAKATGTMTYPFGGATVTIPYGKKKWIAIPELQNTATYPNFINDVFNWANNTVADRLLIVNYWQPYQVGNGDLLQEAASGYPSLVQNQAGADWVSNTTNKYYNGTAVLPLS